MNELVHETNDLNIILSKNSIEKDDEESKVLERLLDIIINEKSRILIIEGYIN